jgi:hypothetical protein
MSTHTHPVAIDDDSPIDFMLSYSRFDAGVNCDICAQKLETERWTARFSSFGYEPLNICADCLARSDRSPQRLKQLITTAADEYERHVIKLRSYAAQIERVPLGNPAQGDEAPVRDLDVTPFNLPDIPF